MVALELGKSPIYGAKKELEIESQLATQGKVPAQASTMVEQVTLWIDQGRKV
jgi:hypothetical protein